MRLQDLLTERAERTPDRIAFVAGRSRPTYSQLDEMSDALAGTLAEHAVRRGDRLAIFSDTWGESVIALLASLKAGAIAFPLDPLTPAEGLTGLLRAWRVRALVTEARLASTAAVAISTADSVRLVILAGAREREPATGCIRFEDAIASRPSMVTESSKANDVAFVLADERPDAPPAATLLRHGDLIDLMAAARPRHREEDAIITSLRLNGTPGLSQLFGAIRDGVTLMHSSSSMSDTRPLPPAASTSRTLQSTR